MAANRDQETRLELYLSGPSLSVAWPFLLSCGLGWVEEYLGLGGRGERGAGSSFYGNGRGKRKQVGFYLEVYRNKEEGERLAGWSREEEALRCAAGPVGSDLL